MLNRRGFTLIEILIVIAILGILIGISVYYGLDIMVKSRVESETRQFYSDLTNARMNALQKKHMFFVTFSPNQYTITEDTYPPPDGNNRPDPQDRVFTQRTVGYKIQEQSGATAFDFSAAGLVTDPVTLIALSNGATYVVHVVSTGPTPSFDCIILSASRIIMGKWDGTTCNPQ